MDSGRKKIHNTSTDIEFYIVICRQKVGHTHHTQRKNKLSMHSKINITIRFSKKRGTQKCNLYCYTGKPPRSVAHRSEARVHRKVYIFEKRLGKKKSQKSQKSTAKYTSLQNNENMTEWYSLLFTHVRLSNRQSSTPVLGNI